MVITIFEKTIENINIGIKNNYNWKINIVLKNFKGRLYNQLVVFA